MGNLSVNAQTPGNREPASNMLPPVIFNHSSNQDSFKSLSRSEIAEIVAYISAQTGSIKDVKRAPRGDLLIYPHDAAQKAELLKIKEVNGIKVQTSLTKAETESRVIIHSVPTSISDIDICQQLSHQGVRLATRWHKIDQSGGKTPTGTVCLTFEHNQPPDTVRLDFQQFRTKPYIPRPKICYNCWGFNHLAAACPVAKKCRTCAGSHKPEDSCAANGHCPTCLKTGHSAGTEDCPIYASRQKTIQVAKEKNITIAEAAALLNQENKDKALQEKKSENHPTTDGDPEPHDARPSRPSQDDLRQMKKELESLKKQVHTLTATAVHKHEVSSLPMFQDVQKRLSSVEAIAEETAAQNKACVDKIDQLQMTLIAQLAGVRKLLIPSEEGSDPQSTEQKTSKGRPQTKTPPQRKSPQAGTPTKRKTTASLGRNSNTEKAYRSPPSKQIGLQHSSETTTQRIQINV